MTRRTFAIKYLRSFELFTKSARIELLQTYQDAEWSGLLAGAPASVVRSGWADTEARFAVNLIGAPPLRAEEFSQYHADGSETIVGLGLVVQFPTGKYLEDKLLNIGTNRFTPGLPIARCWNVKLKYVGLRKQRFIGSETNNLFVSTKVLW